MSDADAGWLLVHCFERAVANPCGATMDALCSATVALALTHRATAFGPERAVRMLKDLLRGHGGAGWSPSIVADRGILSAQPESLIYTKLFGWWVSAYYADRPSTIPQSSAATARGA